MTSEYRSELSRTWRLALPVVGTQVAVFTMGLVDMIMVGSLGEVAIGSVGVGNAVFMPIVFLFAGVLMSLDAIVGHNTGAGNDRQSGIDLWQGYWFALITGVPLTFVFLDAAWIADVLGQTPDVTRETGAYLLGRSGAVFSTLAFTAQRGFLSGLGDTRSVLIASLVANVANAIADFVLIHGHLGAPAMGVAGAGVASSISMLVLLLVGTLLTHQRKYRARHDTGFHGLNKTRIRALLALGVPMGLHVTVEMAGFSFLTILAGWMGESALAPHQIAMTLVSATFMVPLGISTAASVRVAQCTGAGDMRGAGIAGRIALAMGASFMTLGALAFLAFPSLLASPFTQDPALIASAVTLIQLAGVFQISDGLQVVAAGCLRGVGNTRLPLLINSFAFWCVGIPLGGWLAFEKAMGPPGLWIGLILALTMVAATLTWKFLTSTPVQPTASG